MTSIKEIKWQGANAIEISTSALSAIITLDYGPRIAYFGRPNENNWLFWDENNLGRNDWLLRGGHRVWSTRIGADESEDVYIAENAPCSVLQKGKTLNIMSAPIQPLGVIRGMTLEFISESHLRVSNHITNISDMLFSGGVWAITCTAPSIGRTWGIPLGNGTDWDVFHIVYPKSWAGHSSRINDPQFELTESAMIFTPDATETKRALKAPRGIIAMRDEAENFTFAKRAEYEVDSAYPMGSNIALYSGADSFMIEMENMGSETTIFPSKTKTLVEDWVVSNSAIDLENTSALEGMFSL